MDVLRKLWMWLKDQNLLVWIIRFNMLAVILLAFFLSEWYLQNDLDRKIMMGKIANLEEKIDTLLDTERTISIDEPVIIDEEPKAPLSMIETITPSEYTSRKFSYDFDFSGQNRKEDFGQVSEKELEGFLYHTGGATLNYQEAYDILTYVMGRMPNIRSSEGLKLLILESCVAETLFGKVSYVAAAKKGDNGLGQIRVDTAKDLIKWLGYTDTVNPLAKNAMMSFYDRKLSLKDNLYSNVHFTFAVMIQEYWRKVPNLNQMDLNHVGDRAILWKSVYNSENGAGTVKAYVERVTYFHNHNTDVSIQQLSFNK